MGDKVFLDTSILLRITIPAFPLYEKAMQLIATQYRADAELWINRQVIREYLVQATRPQSFMKPLGIKDALKRIEKMQSQFTIADEVQDVTLRLFTTLQRYPVAGKQIHDANIVATMHVNDIGILMTTNVSDFKRFTPEIQLIPLTNEDDQP